MIRIAGGVYPWVKEEHYFSKGHYRIDNYASDTMRNSLMYRLSYYRFGQQQTAYGKESGYDTVRQQVVGVIYLLLILYNIIIFLSIYYNYNLLKLNQEKNI